MSNSIPNYEEQMAFLSDPHYQEPNKTRSNGNQCYPMQRGERGQG